MIFNIYMTFTAFSFHFSRRFYKMIMSFIQCMYYKLLSALLQTVIKSKSIPENPSIETGIDISRPIIYILLYNSKIDLVTLRQQCLKNNFPDPMESLVINGIQLPRCIFIYDILHLVTKNKLEKQFLKSFYKYLNLHLNNKNLNIQMIFISVIFSRRPIRKKRNINQSIQGILRNMQKLFSVILFGRDSFVLFSPSISSRWIANKYQTSNKTIINTFLRIARMYFFRQNIATLGPSFLENYDLFNRLLVSKTISRAVQDEAKNKKISHKKAKKHAINLMKEIAANYSYNMIRLTDRILSFIWKLLYQKINVKNAERVRQLAYAGHEIIYIPCHRSHMDYLLLSYVLYHYGLALPHIAAGINLNFWPTGPIFRRLGAFFIRRTFKSNKLYSTIFREYLSELFIHGHSVGFFIEGSRSRTGRLLLPKTGILSMIIQTLLQNKKIHHITLIPIYMGYEHVIEVNSYERELSGIIKKKESFLQMLYGLKKLCNLGQGYINFGEPLSLKTWLTQHIPDWRSSINLIDFIRPNWFTHAVNHIATDLMTRINNASAMNAVNLCYTALLASHPNFLTRKQLIEQLDCYLSLMRNVPYSTESIIPAITANEIFNYALKTNKLEVKKNIINEDMVLSCKQNSLLSAYYRNNIVHMIILPSLIAAVIMQRRCISDQELFRYIYTLYPILKAELFLQWNDNSLTEELNKLTKELLRQNLIIIENRKLQVNPTRSYTLQLLAESVQETLQRYAIIFWCIIQDPAIEEDSLKKKSQLLAKKISFLHKAYAVDFFDKSTFNTLISTLRHKGYIKSTYYSIIPEKIIKVYWMITELISLDVRLVIENSII